jgi:methionine sulfoxide reductase heme-binding subunit
MTMRWPLLLGILAGPAAIGAGFVVGSGSAEDWQLAARWTARISFPLFIITYAASSLVRLWPSAWHRTVLRDRRWWGLGFAAAHTVHLGVLTYYLYAFGEPPTLTTILGGGLAYALMFLMALTSTNAAMRTMGRGWKRLHSAGIHWLWFIFTFTYFGRVLAGEDLPYAALALLAAISALGLRIATRRR